MHGAVFCSLFVPRAGAQEQESTRKRPTLFLGAGDFNPIGRRKCALLIYVPRAYMGGYAMLLAVRSVSEKTPHCKLEVKKTAVAQYGHSQSE